MWNQHALDSESTVPLPAPGVTCTYWQNVVRLSQSSRGKFCFPLGSGPLWPQGSSNRSLSGCVWGVFRWVWKDAALTDDWQAPQLSVNKQSSFRGRGDADVFSAQYCGYLLWFLSRSSCSCEVKCAPSVSHFISTLVQRTPNNQPQFSFVQMKGSHNNTEGLILIKQTGFYFSISAFRLTALSHSV